MANFKSRANLTSEYISPIDFTANYSSSNSILTNLPTIASTQVNYIKVFNNTTKTCYTYVNGENECALYFNNSYIYIYRLGLLVEYFDVNDTYEVGVNILKKSYDSNLDVTKTVNQSPDSSKYVLDSLVDTTNVAVGTNYYPSSTGMSMDGFKDLTLTGKIIVSNAVTYSIAIEVSNDEDSVTADWTQIYVYDNKNNNLVNIISQINAGTLLFALDLSNLNYSLFRVKYIAGDSTNTTIIKMRRKAL